MFEKELTIGCKFLSHEIDLRVMRSPHRCMPGVVWRPINIGLFPGEDGPGNIGLTRGRVKPKTNREEEKRVLGMQARAHC